MTQKGTIEVSLNVLPQYTMQLPFPEYDHVVQALLTHRAEEALTDWTQIVRARRDLHDLDARWLSYGVESPFELVIVVFYEVLRCVTKRRSLPELLTPARPSNSDGAFISGPG